MGAAGWDGVATPMMALATAATTVTVEEPTLGQLHVRARRLESDSVAVSPLLEARGAAGLPPAPSIEDRGSRAVWMLRGNNALADDGVTMTAMNPVSLPSGSVADGTRPLVIPPHATSLAVSAQLGGVVGAQPLFQCLSAPADALQGLAVVLAVRDSSMQDALLKPLAYERRAAWMVGLCGDGFVRVGPPGPAAAVADWRDQTLTIVVSGPGYPVPLTRTSSLRSYRHGLDELLAMVTTTATLLPGDLLSLGAPAEELLLGAEQLVDRIVVNSSWHAQFEIEVDDRRSAFLSVSRCPPAHSTQRNDAPANAPFLAVGGRSALGRSGSRRTVGIGRRCSTWA
jgi:2-keto-4-pentenoate hydratase/2-oxohepta-3-ene-1,7-dioic acid hydratase in catechol pathway